MTAYIVLAHDDPRMLARLLYRLAGRPVYVHLDARQDVSDYDSIVQIGRRPGMRYVRSRVAVNWGGLSAVRAMAASVREVESCSPAESVVFLSGHCYPVRSIPAFEEFLNGSPHRVHARAYSASVAGGWHTDRVLRSHGFDAPLVTRYAMGTVRRKAIRRAYLSLHLRRRPTGSNSVEVHVGSQWMAMPLACAQEAASMLDDPVYTSLFRDSYAPDEMFFHSYIYNSSWRKQTEFGGAEEVPEGGKVSGIPNFHLLDASMRGRVEAARLFKPTRREYFVRKLFSSRDGAILDRLDEGG